MLVVEKKSPDLIRIDDTRYLFESHDHPVIISVPKVTNNGRLSRLVAEKVFEILLGDEAERDKDFLVYNRYWKIFPKDQSAGYFWSLANYVHKVYRDTHSQTFNVYETGYFGSWRGLSADDSAWPARPSIDSMDSPLFTDPFTELATIAFQKYETAYCHRDYFTLDQYQTRLIIQKGQVLLVDASSQDQELIRETLDQYLAYIIEMFGKKKVDEVIKRYRLTFDETVGLTPEHVYRINVGVHDICIDDIEDLWNSLKAVMPKYTRKILHRPLLDFLNSIPSDQLPGRVKRRLYQRVKSCWGTTKTGDLTQWYANVTAMRTIEDLRQVSPQAFNELMSLLLPDEDSCDRALTGRKTYGFVRSYYNNAETKEFKPWVDQQDFFQTTVLLRKNPNNIDLFYEKLSYVIAKKHLAKRISEKEFRVGGLIPAPLGFGWLEVTSCISTPTGFHSYTLESVHTGVHTDKIKLYRSTASDPCALRSAESVWNDINGINPPGKLGERLGEVYEEEFFKQGTIPVWVGYVELAKQELVRRGGSIKSAYQYLLMANEVFLKFLTQEFQRKTFQQIVREHDTIINDLFRRKRRSFGSYSDLTRMIRKSVLERVTGQISSENEERIAQKLFDQLDTYSEAEEDPAKKFAIVRLKDDLYRHVLQYYEISFLKEEERSRRFYSDILKFKQIFEKVDEDDQYAVLSEWVSRYEEIAEKLGEDLGSKKSQNIVLAGHSLGGACALSHMVWYFSKKDGGRLPCPGHQCMGYVYCDPGSSDADNEHFKAWGYKHRHLMKRLKCGFYLKRIHEAGDVITSGGEAHLGATYSKEEDEKLKGWFQYNFLIRERLKHPKNLAIAMSAPEFARDECRNGTIRKVAWLRRSLGRWDRLTGRNMNRLLKR